MGREVENCKLRASVLNANITAQSNVTSACEGMSVADLAVGRQ